MDKQFKVEILAIGNELTRGEIVNSNASWLSEQLFERAYQVLWHTTIPDDESLMCQAFDSAMARAGLIVCTGGLGPTADDFTVEVFAKWSQQNLILDEESLANIETRLAKMGRVATPNQRKQAYYPEHAKVLKNKRGTAPGVFCVHQGSIFILLPGVPSEMQPMFLQEAMTYLQQEQKQQSFSDSLTLRSFGAAEGKLDHILRSELTNRVELSGATLSFRLKFPEILLKLVAFSDDQNKATQAVMQAKQLVYEKIGEYIYGEGDSDLAEVVVALARQKKQTIACAESCTGGYLAHTITMVSGSSEVFLEGLVTYANEAKISRLGGGIQDDIQNHGAVSEQVALKMANQVKQNLKASIGVGITGIAGPTGGSAEKPVGLVFIAVVANNLQWVRSFTFDIGREAFKKMVTAIALNKIRKYLRTGEPAL